MASGLLDMTREDVVALTTGEAVAELESFEDVRDA